MKGNRKYQVGVITKSPCGLKHVTEWLANQGHVLQVFASIESAQQALSSGSINCLMVDETSVQDKIKALIEKLKSTVGCEQLLTVVITDNNEKKAYEYEADGLVNTTINEKQFLQQFNRIMENAIELQFWGVTGAFPAPGIEHIKYGGQTCCISVKFSNDKLVILDAGSGLISFGTYTIDNQMFGIEADILISHEHWDHIHGLLFFKPLYHANNRFTILGPAQKTGNLKTLLSNQMDGVFFPVKLEDLPASLTFVDLVAEQTIVRDGITISTILLQHPSVTLGYKLSYRGHSICHFVDNEMYPSSHPHFNQEFVAALTRLAGNSELLIMDCSFTDEEYPSKIGWGHACPSHVAEFAHNARVKTLCLHHHDHYQHDAVIDQKLHDTKKILDDLDSSVECISPVIGEIISL